MNTVQHPRKYNDGNHRNPERFKKSGEDQPIFRLSRPERQQVTALQQKKFRYRQHQFILEGAKLLKEALEAQFPIGRIYLGHSAHEKNICAGIPVNWDTVKIVRDADIRSMSSLKNPEGILAIASLPEYSFPPEDTDRSPFLYLWEINDPGNLGTILRTARWFGVRHIIISPNSVDPYSPKVVRGSMGSIFHLSIYQNIDVHQLIQFTQRHAIDILCADPGGAPLQQDLPEHWGLVLGSESHGLPESIKNVARDVIAVPKHGSGESLNLSVSAGILLYELSRQKET